MDGTVRFEPQIYASLITSDCEVRLSIYQHPGNETLAPFPVVDIGRFSWQPSIEQLKELRAKLTAYITAHASWGALEKTIAKAEGPADSAALSNSPTVATREPTSKGANS